MALIWWEIALVVGLNAAILAGTLLLFIRVGAPKLLSRAEIWMGGAIGRFMANLAQQAAEEEGGETLSSPSGGALNLGGFKIDAGTIQSIAEILKVVQSLGFLKGGGGSGQHPLLK